jgi:hypothetical protein
MDWACASPPDICGVSASLASNREKSARTVASPDGLLIVDYAASGRPLGVEITGPQAVPLDRLNQFLAELGEPPLAGQDYRPARAAWVDTDAVVH